VERMDSEDQKGGLGFAFTKIGFLSLLLLSTWDLHTLERSSIQEFL
jgi:hypothetical protein